MVNLPHVVNRNLGDVVRIPFIADNPRKPPTIFVYDKEYIESFSAMATYEGYYITIDGLPAGNYICHVRDVQNADIEIYISSGLNLDTGIGSYVISENRVLGISEDMPLNIVDVVTPLFCPNRINRFFHLNALIYKGRFGNKRFENKKLTLLGVV